MNELALFAGIGGGVLAGKLLGWRTVCAVERDAYAAAVLAHWQNEGNGQTGILEPFPIWSDVRTFDGRPWRGIVDVVSGGFPCQDISVAGSKQGLDGERSGLWVEMARIIREVRPAFAWVENSPNLVNCGLDRVLADLAALGFDARWGVLGARDVGAWHDRERIWIKAAHADRVRQLQPQGRITDSGRWIGDGAAEAADVDGIGRQRRSGIVGEAGRREPAHGGTAHAYARGERLEGPQWRGASFAAWHEAFIGCDAEWWSAEPGVVRMVHGVPAAVDRIRGLGNAQVPAVAARAWLGLQE